MQHHNPPSKSFFLRFTASSSELAFLVTNMRTLPTDKRQEMLLVKQWTWDRHNSLKISHNLELEISETKQKLPDVKETSFWVSQTHFSGPDLKIWTNCATSSLAWKMRQNQGTTSFHLYFQRLCWPFWIPLNLRPSILQSSLWKVQYCHTVQSEGGTGVICKVGDIWKKLDDKTFVSYLSFWNVCYFAFFFFLLILKCYRYMMHFMWFD